MSVLRTALILLLIFIGPWAWASRACEAKSLKLKDCHLKLGEKKLHIWNDKVFLSTNVERDMKPLPKSTRDWAFVRVSQKAGRSFLELGLWQTPQGESAVESLSWLVYEVQNGALVQRLNKVIQKRKKVIPQAQGEGAVSTPFHRTEYKVDRKAKYGLSVKNKKIHWRVSQEEGSF